MPSKTTLRASLASIGVLAGLLAPAHAQSSRQIDSIQRQIRQLQRELTRIKRALGARDAAVVQGAVGWFLVAMADRPVGHDDDGRAAFLCAPHRVQRHRRHAERGRKHLHAQHALLSVPGGAVPAGA